MNHDRRADAALSVIAAYTEDEAVVERVADAIILAGAGPGKKLADMTNEYSRDYALRKARAALAELRKETP